MISSANRCLQQTALFGGFLQRFGVTFDDVGQPDSGLGNYPKCLYTVAAAGSSAASPPAALAGRPASFGRSV